MKELKDKLKPWTLLIGLIAGALVVCTAIILLLFNLTDYAISFAAISATLFRIYTSIIPSILYIFSTLGRIYINIWEEF